MHALGLEFGSAAQLSKRPGGVWKCLWGNVLKRSPGIIRKSRVSYPGPGFISSATWPSLPKKHYNGLNQTKLRRQRQRIFRRVDQLLDRQSHTDYDPVEYDRLTYIEYQTLLLYKCIDETTYKQ